MTVRKGGWLAEKKGLAYIIKEGKMKKKIKWICERLKAGGLSSFGFRRYGFIRM